VLRAHIEHHLFSIEESFLTFCYWLILHIAGKIRGPYPAIFYPLSSILYLLSAYFTSIKLVS
jgi:hypothetical protein